MDIEQQLKDAHAEGRRQGLEDAAKRAELCADWYEGHGDSIAHRIHDEILALLNSPNTSPAAQAEAEREE